MACSVRRSTTGCSITTCSARGYPHGSHLCGRPRRDLVTHCIASTLTRNGVKRMNEENELKVDRRNVLLGAGKAAAAGVVATLGAGAATTANAEGTVGQEC